MKSLPDFLPFDASAAKISETDAFNSARAPAAFLLVAFLLTAFLLAAFLLAKPHRVELFLLVGFATLATSFFNLLRVFGWEGG